MTTSRTNGGFIVVIIGGVLALLAFFFMPYFSAGIFSFTGQQLANLGSQSGLGLSSQLQNLQLLWLEPVIAGIIVIVGLFQAFKSVKDEMSAQRTAIGLIVLAIVTDLVLLGRYVYDMQPPAQTGPFQYTGPTLASFYGSGFWVFMVAMVVVVVGGIMAARSA